MKPENIHLFLLCLHFKSKINLSKFLRSFYSSPDRKDSYLGYNLYTDIWSSSIVIKGDYAYRINTSDIDGLYQYLLNCKYINSEFDIKITEDEVDITDNNTSRLMTTYRCKEIIFSYKYRTRWSRE